MTKTLKTEFIVSSGALSGNLFFSCNGLGEWGGKRFVFSFGEAFEALCPKISSGIPPIPGTGHTYPSVVFVRYGFSTCDLSPNVSLSGEEVSSHRNTTATHRSGPEVYIQRGRFRQPDMLISATVFCFINKAIELEDWE